MLQPKPGADESYPVDKATAISGEKLLRNIMLDNKIELYAAYVRLEFPFPPQTILFFRESVTHFSMLIPHGESIVIGRNSRHP